MHWSRALLLSLLGLLVVMPVAGSAQSMPFVHKKKYAMGTLFEIVAYDPSVTRASAAIDKAFDQIVRLDELLSNYKPDSELSLLNRSAHFHAQMVSPDLYRVIEQSLQYSRISKGKFDITVGPLVDLWKAALRSGQAPSGAEEAQARSCVGYEKIELLPTNEIKFRSPCLRIDLGGIGKGYALDRAVETLRAEGISRALLDAGGSTIYAMGAPPGQSGWLVHMRDPSGYAHPQVMLSDNSLSTSEQSPPSLLQNNPAGHIIDPETAVPLRSAYAVSVVAKTATASDALSTTLLLLGPAGGKPIVDSLKGAAAIWVARRGEPVVASSGAQIVLGQWARRSFQSGGGADSVRSQHAEGVSQW